MPITDVILEPLHADKSGKVNWPASWASFFTEVFMCIFGWKRSYTGTLSKTWALIGAASEASQTVTITGARTGDVVIVQPATKTTGIVDTIGVVTADDTVTVFAQNTTAGGITPGAKTYRVICLQQ